MVIMSDLNQKYTAKEARAFIEKRKAEEKLHQVSRLLDHIKNLVYDGATEVSLAYFPNLEEEHFRELEDLGFKVVRPDHKVFISMFGTERQDLITPGSVSW
jgi:hypothetical protein